MDQKYVFFWNWLFTLSLIWGSSKLLSVSVALFFSYFWIVFHKEINPEYSLEGLSLRLQCFGHLMQRADSLEKILMLEKIEGRKRKGGGQWMRWLDGIINSVGKLWANFEQTLRDGGGQRSWHAAGHGVAKSWTWLNHWTTAAIILDLNVPTEGPSEGFPVLDH